MERKFIEFIVDYCMIRLVFGIVSVIFFAISFVLYFIEENDMELNFVVRVVKEFFYIDDGFFFIKRSKKLFCFISSFRSFFVKVDLSCINGIFNSIDILNLILLEIYSFKFIMIFSNLDSFFKVLGMECSFYIEVFK